MDSLRLDSIGASEYAVAASAAKTEFGAAVSSTEIRAEMKRIGGSQSNITSGSFKEDIKSAPIIDYFKTPAQLESEGYEKSDIMDMNGGQYYYNPKTKVSFRIGGLMEGSNGIEHAVSWKNGKDMAQNAYYDKDGKLIYGLLHVRQADGRIKVYRYELDAEGNKFVKSVEYRDAQYEQKSVQPYE